MEEVGTFQLCTTMGKNKHTHDDLVFETIMDTRTGKIISRETHSINTTRGEGEVGYEY
tara:strand:+ start:2662 stop:2835 length:174 start_codon:yes stop_codon:yes gene_type:complete